MSMNVHCAKTAVFWELNDFNNLPLCASCMAGGLRKTRVPAHVRRGGRNPSPICNSGRVRVRLMPHRLNTIRIEGDSHA